MKKELRGEKEIHLSHCLSGKVNVRKERVELREAQIQQIRVITDLKTA